MPDEKKPNLMDNLPEQAEKLLREALAIPLSERISDPILRGYWKWHKINANVQGGPLTPQVAAVLVMVIDRRRKTRTDEGDDTGDKDNG